VASVIFFAIFEELLESTIFLAKDSRFGFATLGNFSFSLKVVIEGPDLLFLIQVLSLVLVVLLSKVVNILTKVLNLAHNRGIALLSVMETVLLKFNSVFVLLNSQGAAMNIKILVLELSLIAGLKGIELFCHVFFKTKFDIGHLRELLIVLGLEILAFGSLLFDQEKLHFHSLFDFSLLISKNFFVFKNLLSVLICNLFNLSLFLLDSINSL
jgi:hypothetical protein